jgi:hypothetical protein
MVGMAGGRPPAALGEDPRAARLYAAVRGAVADLGGTTVRETRSQVAFRRRTTFAAVWVPGRYLRRAGAPLVLTVHLRERDPSPRWKEVVEPAPGRFTHHLELQEPGDVDGELRNWLRRAWSAAG